MTFKIILNMIKIMVMIKMINDDNHQGVGTRIVVRSQTAIESNTQFVGDCIPGLVMVMVKKKMMMMMMVMMMMKRMMMMIMIHPDGH